MLAYASIELKVLANILHITYSLVFNEWVEKKSALDFY